MTCEYFFKNAKWVGALERNADSFAILRGRFSVSAPEKVTLHVLGLGFFKCYINGVCINPDSFLPLSSEYEAGCEPSGEIFSGHRVYVPEFDITSYVKEGENSIAIHYGGGGTPSASAPSDCRRSFTAFPSRERTVRSTLCPTRPAA